MAYNVLSGTLNLYTITTATKVDFSGVVVKHFNSNKHYLHITDDCYATLY